jgi:4-hydroxy-3-methylbut-2-enyl diphosphate reductase
MPAGSAKTERRRMTDPTPPTLEVIVARSAGTCFGVERAIEMAEQVRRPILGPIVHNPRIVQGLAAKNIPILERYADLDALAAEGITEVVITAHGYPRELKQELDVRGVRYHDATCPILLKGVYGKIRRLEAQGYKVILIGNPNHAEIIASRSYGTDILVVYSDEDVTALPEGLGKAAAICQTTITKEKFLHLVAEIRQRRAPDLEVIDTRCRPVKNQQAAVERLARSVDAMIIIGGFNSSNTTNLARLSRLALPDTTYHIDAADLLQPEWFHGIRRLGVGAGTSTPKSQIAEVLDRVRELVAGEVLIHEEDHSGVRR